MHSAFQQQRRGHWEPQDHGQSSQGARVQHNAGESSPRNRGQQEMECDPVDQQSIPCLTHQQKQQQRYHHKQGQHHPQHQQHQQQQPRHGLPIWSLHERQQWDQRQQEYHRLREDLECQIAEQGGPPAPTTQQDTQQQHNMQPTTLRSQHQQHNFRQYRHCLQQQQQARSHDPPTPLANKCTQTVPSLPLSPHTPLPKQARGGDAFSPLSPHTPGPGLLLPDPGPSHLAPLPSASHHKQLPVSTPCTSSQLHLQPADPLAFLDQLPPRPMDPSPSHSAVMREQHHTHVTDPGARIPAPLPRASTNHRQLLSSPCAGPSQLHQQPAYTPQPAFQQQREVAGHAQASPPSARRTLFPEHGQQQQQPTQQPQPPPAPHARSFVQPQAAKRRALSPPPVQPGCRLINQNALIMHGMPPVLRCTIQQQQQQHQQQQWTQQANELSPLAPTLPQTPKHDHAPLHPATPGQQHQPLRQWPAQQFVHNNYQQQQQHHQQQQQGLYPDPPTSSSSISNIWRKACATAAAVVGGRPNSAPQQKNNSHAASAQAHVTQAATAAAAPASHTEVSNPNAAPDAEAAAHALHTEAAHSHAAAGAAAAARATHNDAAHPSAAANAATTAHAKMAQAITALQTSHTKLAHARAASDATAAVRADAAAAERAHVQAAAVEAKAAAEAAAAAAAWASLARSGAAPSPPAAGAHTTAPATAAGAGTTAATAAAAGAAAVGTHQDQPGSMYGSPCTSNSPRIGRCRSHEGVCEGLGGLRDLPGGMRERGNDDECVRALLGAGAGFAGNAHTSIPQCESCKERGAMSLACFDVGREIGRGGFALVHLVRHKATGQLCALKVLNKAHVLRLGEANHVVDESKLLQRLSRGACPFIIHLYGAFQDERCLYLCMEYVQGGDPFHALDRRNSRRLNEDVARFLAAQIILGLEVMHSRGICYRDLKPENIMLDKDGYIRLADLGFAKALQPGHRANTLCGTPEYMSPEALFQQGHSFETDLWSLGCVIYEMLSSIPPFYCNNNVPVIRYRMLVFCGSIRGRMKPFFPQQGDISDTAWDLIFHLLRPDPVEREGSGPNGGFQALKSHPWFQGLNWCALWGKAFQSPLALSSAAETTSQSAWDVRYRPCFSNSGPTDNMERAILTENEQMHFVDF